MGGPLSAGIRVDAVENVWQARGIIGRKVAAGGGGRKLVGEKAFTVAPRTLNWNALEAETERVLQKFEALASELAAPHRANYQRSVLPRIPLPPARPGSR